MCGGRIPCGSSRLASVAASRDARQTPVRVSTSIAAGRHLPASPEVWKQYRRQRSPRRNRISRLQAKHSPSRYTGHARANVRRHDCSNSSPGPRNAEGGPVWPGPLVVVCQPANSAHISEPRGRQRTSLVTTAVPAGSEVSPAGAETSDRRCHSSGARFTSSESAACASPTILAPTLFRNRE